MKLVCTDCGTEGTRPFTDSAPYATGSPKGQCATHGPSKAPALDRFTRAFTRDFRTGDSFDLLPSRRFVGMEFEMYHRMGVTNRVLDLSRDWRLLNCGVSEDGSITSRANIEIKTPPAQGDDAILWAQAIGSICPSYGMVVNKSCGLHVHVDIRDLSAMGMKRLGLLAMAVEPVLYAALPTERRTNGMAGPLHVTIQELLSARASFEHLENLWGEHGIGRHVGLNIYARGRHGTVEFRYHSGTLNPEKVKHWARICTGLVDAAAGGNISTSTLGKFPPDFEGRLALLRGAARLPEETMAYLLRRIKHFGQAPEALHQEGMRNCQGPEIMDLEMPRDWPFHGARMDETLYCRLHLMYERIGSHCPGVSDSTMYHFPMYHFPMAEESPWPGLGKWVLLGTIGSSTSSRPLYWIYLCPQHRRAEIQHMESACARAPQGMHYDRVARYRREGD